MINQLQTQKQQYKILPQQIQLLNLFHLNMLELDQRIQDEIDENPLLEEVAASEEVTVDKTEKDTVQDFQNWDEYGYDDIPDYKREYENYLSSEKIPDRPLAESIDFRQELKKQLRFLDFDEKENLYADFIIDSINEQGFLEGDLETIANELSFKYQSWVEESTLVPILAAIQALEPRGAASRNLQEFFLIQLNEKDGRCELVQQARCVVRDCFTHLRQGNMDKIKRELNIDADGLQKILRLLATLKTRPIDEPGAEFQTNHAIIPDFVISQEGEQIQVNLFKSRAAGLHINQSWMGMVHDAENDKTKDQQTRQYLRSKLNSAQWFVNALQQRESNMLKVMRAIVKWQEEYFKEGNISMLKPMVLKNIAEQTGLDISTISRITSNKYADTPFGYISLKELFSEGLSNAKGEVTSNKVIQKSIEEIIDAEDKTNPYTDQQIVKLLVEKGYAIARRTVAKYREQLRIPVAQMRAIWGN